MMLIGYLGAGENLNNQDAKDCMFELNDIVDGWNLEDNMIAYNNFINFPLDGKHKYTIGDGGDIDYTRPLSGIKSATFTREGVTYPLKSLTQKDYMELSLKNMVLDIPYFYYYNPTLPLGEIYVHPISSIGEINIMVQSFFNGFETLDDEIELPMGYISALRFTLAVRLGELFNLPTSESIQQLAVGAKAKIKSVNSVNKREHIKYDRTLQFMSGSNVGNYKRRFYGGY